MLAGLFTGGVTIYAFYAMQPYLLELYGDPRAYRRRRTRGRDRRRRADRGRPARPARRPGVSPAHVGAAGGTSLSTVMLGGDRLVPHFWVTVVVLCPVGTDVRGAHARAPGVPEWAHRVEAAGHGACRSIRCWGRAGRSWSSRFSAGLPTSGAIRHPTHAAPSFRRWRFRSSGRPAASEPPPMRLTPNRRRLVRNQRGRDRQLGVRNHLHACHRLRIRDFADHMTSAWLSAACCAVLCFPLSPSSRSGWASGPMPRSSR